MDEWLSQRSAKPSTAVRIRQAPPDKVLKPQYRKGFGTFSFYPNSQTYPNEKLLRTNRGYCHPLSIRRSLKPKSVMRTKISRKSYKNQLQESIIVRFLEIFVLLLPIFSLNALRQLQPANVAEVLTVRQVLVLRRHTDGRLVLTELLRSQRSLEGVVVAYVASHL